VNNSTINHLLDVMAEQITKVQHDFGGDIESPGLTIQICVLEQGFSIQTDLPFGEETAPWSAKTSSA
jgi:hypothetical protein